MEKLANKEDLIYTHLMQQDSLNRLYLWKEIIRVNHDGLKTRSHLIATTHLGLKLTTRP